MTEQSGPTPYEAAFTPDDYEHWASVISSSTPYAPAFLEVFEKITDENRREIQKLSFTSPNEKHVAIAGKVRDKSDELWISTTGNKVSLDYHLRSGYKLTMSVDGSGVIAVRGLQVADDTTLSFAEIEMFEVATMAFKALDTRKAEVQASVGSQLREETIRQQARDDMPIPQ